MNDYIHLCSHCNNKTSHQIIADGTLDKTIGEIRYKDGRTSHKIIKTIIYLFVKCKTCGDYSLLGGYNEDYVNGTFDKIPTLFPESNNSNDSGNLGLSVPEKIRGIYKEAFQIRDKSPNAFAGQIRKALEYLCKDKGAIGSNLVKQLNSLVESGVIPTTLSEMTYIIRLIGNRAVHADEQDVSNYDVHVINAFFLSIIEYVYIAPATLEEVKKKLEMQEINSKYDDIFDKVNEILQEVDPIPWMDQDPEWEAEHSDWSSIPPYTYEDETYSLVKKLIKLQSKDELQEYVNTETEFLSDYGDEVVSKIWDVWIKLKK